MNNGNHHIRFLCIDCKTEVYTFGYCAQTERCTTCDWICNAKLTNEEKQKLRAILNKEPEESIHE